MAVIPAIDPMGPNTVWGSHNTGYDPIEMVQKVALIVWSPSLLQWVKLTADVDGNLNVNVASTRPSLAYTAPAPATVSVTSTSSIVIPANANRKGLVIVNIGDVDVFFGIGATALINSGITLVPNGTWVMDVNTFTKDALHAICSATSTLSYQDYQ
jgi:hypothetical protein